MAIEAFSRNDVEPLGEELGFDGFWKLKVLHLRHKRFAGGWSGPIRREVHIRGEAVGVLLYDPAMDAIGLVEQFRPGAWAHGGEPWLLELVAGLIEPDEKPEQVAHRESMEEAGCMIDALEPIIGFYPSPGGCDEYCYLYCAKTDLSDVETLHGLDHENEDIRLHVIQWSDAEQMLAAGRFQNAFLLIGAYWMQNNRERLRQRWLESNA